MIRIRAFFALLLLAASVLPAGAQVVVNIKMARKNFVAGESVPVTVAISNHAGRDLVFQGDSRSNWIEFTVRSSNGNPVSPFGKSSFGAVKVPLGQTASRSFDLASIFPVREMGNYSVHAMVRLPGQTDAFMSNRVLFNVNTARPYWSQKVGVPGSAGQTREFRVMHYSGTGKSQLYGQVVDLRTGQPMQTHSLGEVLMFRKPSVTVDSRQVMHVLYLVGPTLWAHAKIGPDGAFLGRDFHKRGGAADPFLATLPTGAVQVGNSIPYDPKAEAESRDKVRKATDRPAFLYE